LGPDEATALQPFRHKAQPGSIPPQQLEQIAAPSAKDEDLPAERIARQRVLHQSAKTSEPFAHVGRTRSQAHDDEKCVSSIIVNERPRARRLSTYAYDAEDVDDSELGF
jgi:hypothetical protein